MVTYALISLVLAALAGYGALKENNQQHVHDKIKILLAEYYERTGEKRNKLEFPPVAESLSKPADIAQQQELIQNKDAAIQKLSDPVSEKDTPSFIFKFISWQPSSLPEAARYDRIDLIEKFLAEGKDINETALWAETGLIKATKEGHIDTVKYLLEHGANVNLHDDSGKTAIIYALDNNNLPLIQLLHNFKANVNLLYRAPSTDWLDSLRTPLAHACSKGDLDKAKLLIELGADVNLKDKKGYTALSRTSIEGHSECVQLLLSHGADIDATNDDRMTPLMEASKHGHVSVVTILLAHNADVNAINKSNRTALQEVTKKGPESYQIAELLLEHGARINKVDKTPAIIHLINSDQAALIPLLVKHKANINEMDENGNTALKKSILKNDYNVTKLLLELGADVSLKDTIGFSPLHWAAHSGRTEIVNLLIAHKAEINEISDIGYTPLFEAAENGHEEAVKTLLKHGAHYEVKTDTRTFSPPLMVALEKGHIGIAQALKDAGANINVPDNDGNNILHFAVFKKNYKLATQALAFGADVSHKGNHENTPLQTAAIIGQTDFASLFITHGADVNCANKDGTTPLIEAVRHKHTELVKLLLKHNVDVNKCDNKNNSPLMEAINQHDVETIKFLLDSGARVDHVDTTGKTCLTKALDKNDSDLITLIGNHALKQHADLKKLLGNRSPLNKAAATGNLPAIKALLELAPAFLHFSIDAKDTSDSDNTPLQQAAIKGHKDVVVYLCQKGAPVNVANKDGTTPLMEAARHGHLETVKELIDHGALINAKDNEKETALDNAIKRDRLEIATLLLQKGAELSMPLLISNLWNRDDMVLSIIPFIKDINASDRWERTVFSEAVVYCTADTVKALIAKGANINGKKSWQLPLHKAAENGRTDIVKILLDAGAHVDSHDYDDATALIKASQKGHKEVVELLLNHNALPNKLTRDKSTTALIEAASAGHTEIVKMLLAHHASSYSCDKEGQTSLMKALANKHLDCAYVLAQDHRTDVLVRDKNNKSTLEYALETQDVKFIEFIQKKAQEKVLEKQLRELTKHLSPEDLKQFIKDLETGVEKK